MDLVLPHSRDPKSFLKKGKRKKGKRNNCSVSPSLYTKENPSKTLTNDKGISFCHSGVWTLILCHTIDSFDCCFSPPGPNSSSGWNCLGGR